MHRRPSHAAWPLLCPLLHYNLRVRVHVAHTALRARVKWRSQHWIGCFQFFISTVADTDSDGVLADNTWIVRAGFDDERIGTQLSWCIHHAVMQMLGVSVGVVKPERLSEIWLYVLGCVAGAVLYAIFLASLTAVFAEAGAAERKYRSFMEELTTYSHHYGIPQEMEDRLVNYFQRRYPANASFDETYINSSLSHPLRNEIALYRCREALAVLQVLHDDRLARAIASVLRLVLYVHGDTILWVGEVGTGMYFIDSGQVQVMVQENVVRVLGKGALRRKSPRPLSESPLQTAALWVAHS